MNNLLAALAMALDTLPGEGRVLLLAVLLATALFGFARLLGRELGSTVNVLYRKGALMILVGVPLAVYTFDVQVPVVVDEVVRLGTPWPGYIAWTILAVWLFGVVYNLTKLGVNLRDTRQAVASYQPATEALVARVRHWQLRLNLTGEVQVLVGAAEHAWHLGAFSSKQPRVIVLPAVALNWPSGVVDVMVLTQLAQLSQNSWRWLVLGRCVQALYWPLPWVAKLVIELAEHMQPPAHRLGAAAYRDPPGWQKDARNLTKRGATLSGVDGPLPGQWLRLANSGEVRGEPLLEAPQPRHKIRDPYEQAYWLLAVASILVGVTTTLTLVQRAPEFEPSYLNIKWQDQMVRRIKDGAELADSQD